MPDRGPIRRWLAAAGPAMARVADEPQLWIPGALAWLGGLGWAPLVVAVARTPTQGELAHLGAGIQSSGMWPLNLLLLALGAVAAVVAIVALGSLGNAALDAALVGRRVEPEDVGRRFVAAMVAVAPISLVAFVILVGVIAVAPSEFTRPGAETAPALRVALRLAPLIGAGILVAVVSAVLADLAGRLAVRAGDAGTGIVRAPRLVRDLGLPGAIHAVVTVAAGLLFLAVATLLLGVLWAPIGAELAAGGVIDARAAGLLVGFVGIWLCLVLAGGALQAWGSATWMALLAVAGGARAARPMEAGIDR